MEDLKDIRRQLKENPESRELNNRYAQACLDIAKEYTVTSQGHIFICSPSDLEAVRYVMAKIPNASLLDGETLEEHKRLERAVTQARMNRGKPGSKMGIYYALILFIVMPSMAAPVLLLWELTVLGSGSSPVEWCNRFVSFGLGYALSWSGVSSCPVGCGVSRDLVRMSRLR